MTIILFVIELIREETLSRAEAAKAALENAYVSVSNSSAQSTNLSLRERRAEMQAKAFGASKLMTSAEKLALMEKATPIGPSTAGNDEDVTFLSPGRASRKRRNTVVGIVNTLALFSAMKKKDNQKTTHGW